MWYSLLVLLTLAFGVMQTFGPSQSWLVFAHKEMNEKESFNCLIVDLKTMAVELDINITGVFLE